ncbi:MAG: hypothetical protein ACRYHQ_23410 [Janthinobacterium lividum]
MSRIDDPARLDAVLATLPPADALWLAQHLEQPWQVARRRLDARTQALRAARLVIAPGLRPRPAAEVIAVELQRYLASAWAEQQHHTDLPPGAFERHHVLHRVAVLSGGKAIGWRTVCKALDVPRHDKG